MAGVKDNTAAAVADDVALLKRMLAAKDSYIAELEKRNGLLAEQVELLRKYRFARSSEKWSEEDKRQRWIFDEAETVVSELPPAAEEERFERISYKRRKRRGRRALPADLPRTEILHELTEEQRRCGIEGCERYGECTKLRPLIGEDVREELEFVPARIEVKRHRYRRYGQIACERAEVDEQSPAVISAPREKRIVDGGIVTPSMLSQILVNQ